MDIPHTVARQLAELSGALNEGGADLQAMLEVLIDDLTIAIPTFLGLIVTVPPAPNGGRGVSLTVLTPDSADAAESTLLVPWEALGVPGTGGSVVFYAAQPGAFVDLAAAIRFGSGPDDQPTLDGHLPSVNRPTGPGSPSITPPAAC